MINYSNPILIGTFLILSSTILPIEGLQAQNKSSTVVLQEYVNPSNTIHTHPNEIIHGSPFFNDNWEKGRVWLSSGKKTKKMNLKYKVFTNELLFKRNGRVLAVKPSNMKGFTLNHKGKKLLFKEGFNAPRFKISSHKLLQVIFNGKVKLLKRYRVKLMRGVRPDPISGNITSNFIKSNSYFLVRQHGHFFEVKKLKEKDILDALGDHKRELKKYAESHHLSFKDKIDLKQILGYYDHLISTNK